MSDDSVQPDLDPPALRASLAELSQTLEALRERLTRLERGEGGGPPPRGDGGDDHALSLFQEILSIPAAGLPPGELYALAMDRAARLLSADRTMLFVAETSSGRLVPRSARGFRRDDLEAVSLLPGEGLVGRVFREKRVLVYDPAAGAEEADPFIDRFPVREAIAVPVRAEGEVTGVLYAGRRALGAPFSTNDILLLLLLADRVGSGLVHQGLLERRGSHLAHLKELGAFAEETLIGRGLKQVLTRVCEAGCRLAGARAAAVALLSGDRQLELAAACGLPESTASWRLSARDGLTGELFAIQGPVACRDIQSRRGPENSFLGDGGFHACLGVPLRLGGRALGALYLADTEVKDFSTEEIEAAQVLASLAAVAVENSRVHGELRTAFEQTVAAHEGLVQSEKARALGEMAAGISREFNNIFAIILGKAQLLLARTHDDPLREGLGMLEEAAWRGADIVHRLLGLAATTSEDTVSPVDMTALVQDAVGLTQSRWKDEPHGRGAPIEMATDLQPAPPVAASPTALREAVMNLILNAVDAMPRGGRLGIQIRPSRGGVEIRVTDTGEGIPDDAKPRIFDAFFTTRAPLRMGLGLAVVHAIVTRYRGVIAVETGASGTTVRVWLPGAGPAPPALPAMGHGPATMPEPVTIPEPAPALVPPLVPPEAETRAAPPEPRVAAEPPPRLDTVALETVTPEVVRKDPPVASILVLEEEAQIRSTLVDALTEAGYRVEASAEAPDGLAKLKRGGFDLVLTDLSLPDRSGLQVARSVKRLSPQTAVVLITGWGHLLDHDRLRENGVDLMLVKPFRLDRVLSVVGDALRLRAPV